MRLLRQALEDYEGNTPTGSNTQQEVVMQGPLSEIYTKALGALYAKTDPLEEPSLSLKQVEVKPSLESQANDALMVGEIMRNMMRNDTVPEPNAGTTIYGVSEAEITDGTIAEVATSLSAIEKPDEQFVLVIDGTDLANVPDGSQGMTERFVSQRDAETSAEKRLVLESLVKTYRGNVTTNLKDALKALAKK